MNEKFWYLKNCTLFERLTAEQATVLESRSRLRKFERQSLIYIPSDPGDSLLLLATGRIKIYHLTSDGKQTVLAIINPGEVFGELSVFNGGQREEFAETMEKSSIVLIPRDEVQNVMQQHAELAMGISKLMGVRRRRIERRLKSLLFRSTKERLIYLLLELAEQYGEQDADGILIGLRLSHQELASIIGSTRESVTVALGELQSEGSLHIRRRRITLTNMQRLATSIDVAPPIIRAPAHTRSGMQQANFGT